MGTKEHKEALGQYTQTIFEQSMLGHYGDEAMRVNDDGEYYLLTSEIIQDVILELGIESGQIYNDGGHPALLLMPDPHTFEAVDASYLGQHGHTFCLPLVGTEGEYIGAFHAELEGLLGTTEICYGRLPGCPNLTFFFHDQRTMEDRRLKLCGPIPTIRGRVVVVHRDLDHLTIGIDPYSDTDEVQWHLDQVARDNADRISVRLTEIFNRQK